MPAIASIGGGYTVECGSAALATTTCSVPTYSPNIRFAGATYSSAPAAARQGPWMSADYHADGHKVVLGDSGTSAPLSYVVIAGNPKGDVVKFGQLYLETGTARMVAGSCDIDTKLGTVQFAHWTYTEAPGTCDQKYWTPAVPTQTSGNYITVMDTNLNALSADFTYMLLGN